MPDRRQPRGSYFKPAGFKRNTAGAYWLTCDACGEMEIFYGERRDGDAKSWAGWHADHCPAREAER